MRSMVPGVTKPEIEEKTREDLIAIIHELIAEIERLRGERTNSRNSSQQPSRDFKSEGDKKRKLRKKAGAKKGHEKAERLLVDNPNKVIEVWAESCSKCHASLLDRVPERTIRLLRRVATRGIANRFGSGMTAWAALGSDHYESAPRTSSGIRIGRPSVQRNIRGNSGTTSETTLQRTFHGLGANLLKRYCKYRNCLSVFLHCADVPAHNNACERALRPSVIHRKAWVIFAPIGALRAMRPGQPS